MYIKFSSYISIHLAVHGGLFQLINIDMHVYIHSDLEKNMKIHFFCQVNS